MFGSKQRIVISEPDIEAAVEHLRNLPFMPAAPVAWDRKRFLDTLSALVGKAKCGDCIDVAPGVYAIVKPFGVDLARGPTAPDGRLQVWLCVRAWGTDPERMTSLN